MDRWEKPEILEVSALGEGLGHCVEGTTPQIFAPAGCGYGDSTGDINDGCMSGGLAGRGAGCSVGGDPTYE